MLNAKKRVLFVRKKYKDRANPHYKGDNYVQEALKRNFSLDTLLGLSEDIFQALAKREYSALITHVPGIPIGSESLERFTSNGRITDPRQYYHLMYQPSLELVKRVVSDFKNLPIIAYTGAENNEHVRGLFASARVFDKIIFRSYNPEEDAEKIEKALRSL